MSRSVAFSVALGLSFSGLSQPFGRNGASGDQRVPGGPRPRRSPRAAAAAARRVVVGRARLAVRVCHEARRLALLLGGRPRRRESRVGRPALAVIERRRAAADYRGERLTSPATWPGARVGRALLAGRLDHVLLADLLAEQLVLARTCRGAPCRRRPSRSPAPPRPARACPSTVAQQPVQPLHLARSTSPPPAAASPARPSVERRCCCAHHWNESFTLPRSRRAAALHRPT